MELILTLKITGILSIIIIIFMYFTGHFKNTLSVYDEFEEDNTEG